ncbi:MAG: energy transducer TonB [Vicinamibacteria bacterium]|nr:energy transducer TonB [Vicinamibacteria bacterium]
MSSLSGLRWLVARAVVLVAVLPLFSPVLAQEKAGPSKTLYARMGGYDVIAAVVDDFLSQLAADPAFRRFGQGRSQNTLVKGRQLIVDQICQLSGGPCLYIGRDMKPSHGGLAITDAEWESSEKKMIASLQKSKVGEVDRQEFMAMINKLKPDIVEPPAPQAPGATYDGSRVYAESEVDKSPLLVTHELPKPNLRPSQVVSVTVSWVVTVEGSVHDPSIVASASPEVDVLVVEAIRTWRYAPGEKDGKAVPVRILRTYTFGSGTKN